MIWAMIFCVSGMGCVAAPHEYPTADDCRHAVPATIRLNIKGEDFRGLETYAICVPGPAK